jgi:hypothetical protein
MKGQGWWKFLLLYFNTPSTSCSTNSVKSRVNPIFKLKLPSISSVQISTTASFIMKQVVVLMSFNTQENLGAESLSPLGHFQSIQHMIIKVVDKNIVRIILTKVSSFYFGNKYFKASWP